MDYAQSVSWLESLGEFHMALGLDRTQALLAALGDPQGCAPAIHVAGTNGKGATAAMASAILRTAGKRVGLFTSPHLSRVNERIALGGKPIGDGPFALAISRVKETAEAKGIDVTFFEALTAAAFLAFHDAAVEVMVVEVGLGGRLDSTNVLDPKVTVITSLALDHTAILGETVEKIAAEKAGILKRGRPVVCTARSGEGAAVVNARAEELSAPCYLIERDVRWVERAVGDTAGFVIETTAPAPALTVPHCRLPLLGDHQRDNACAAALAVLLAFPEVPPPVIADGLAKVAWPGRGERLLSGDESATMAETFFDGAHNPAAAEALAVTLAEWPAPGRAKPRRLSMVFAAMKDKDYREIFRFLADLRPAFLALTTVGLARSADPGELLTTARELFDPATRIEAFPKVGAALGAARSHAGPAGRVVVTGSLYLVGKVREALLGPPEAIG